MEPYKIGKCPQCNEKILVRDAAGRWSTMKPNYAQIDLIFQDGLKVRSAICKECAKSPDYAALMDAIFHQDSKACNSDKMDRIKYIDRENNIERGAPVSHQVR